MRWTEEQIKAFENALLNIVKNKIYSGKTTTGEKILIKFKGEHTTHKYFLSFNFYCPSNPHLFNPTSDYLYGPKSIEHNSLPTLEEPTNEEFSEIPENWKPSLF